MPEFSATTAAVEGFQVIKRNPLALVAWGVVYLAATAVAIGLIAATVGFTAFAHFPAFMRAAVNETPPDRELVLGLFTAIGSAFGIVLIIKLVVDAVVVTAVKRAVLRPEDRSLGYMRLGGDEIRTFVVRLVRGAIVAAVWAVVIGGAILLGVLIHPALSVLWCLAGLALVFFVAVKLSLAVSQSFAEQRLNVFGSWSLSTGHFWPLVGAYVLAIIFYIIISLVLSTIGGLAGGNAFMAAIMQDSETVDFEAIGPLMWTAVTVNLVTGLITEVFALPIVGSPPAAAYRDLILDAD